MKIYTIKDIAKEAGVSVTTVSRVLNHRPDVNPVTREKVEKVIAACHFVGNANARGLKQTEGDLVAVILRGHQNPFLNALAEAILQHSPMCNAAFLTEFIDEKADEFQTALRLYHEKRVTGFIFVGSRVDQRAAILSTLELPMVFTTARVDEAFLPQAASVAIDDRAMSRLAAQELLRRGHRKIAVFGGNLGQEGDIFNNRYQGVADAFTQEGLVFDQGRYVETLFSAAESYDTAYAFFQQQPDTTAVFAMSDTVAMSVIRALCDLGRRVPEDVSVFGFDGIEMGKYFLPRLTTVEQPVDDLARESVQILTDMLMNGEKPRHITVDAALRLRESIR